ncbi:hypothetical protein R50073_45680 [Maricurvus nonylphenolicus]|uniref:hypothetical protein n=1 Tax=Maricurvus nonylphenolicus TaxID=1008307 RepID=UPI0036F27760
MKKYINYIVFTLVIYPGNLSAEGLSDLEKRQGIEACVEFGVYKNLQNNIEEYEDVTGNKVDVGSVEYQRIQKELNSIFVGFCNCLINDLTAKKSYMKGPKKIELNEYSKNKIKECFAKNT